MISRKQLSKNLYKLTKKEFPEIFGNETDDDNNAEGSDGKKDAVDELLDFFDEE